MKIKLLEKKEEQKYSEYIINNPKAAFEFSLEWRDVIAKNFGFKPYYLICSDEDGKIKGSLPLFMAKGIFGKRLVSVPYAVYAGCLAGSEEVKVRLLDSSKSLARKEGADFLEIREKEETTYPEDFKLINQVYNFSLSLSENVEEVWKKLPKGSVRWGIKKAQKSDLTWSYGNSEKELREFYDLFILTRKHRGVPGYPLGQFKDILAKFGDKARIYVVRFEDKPVASIFLIYHKKEVRYSFAGAISDLEILRMQPYHLVLWEAIKDACQRGYTQFNFGGATLSANEGGLYGFKKKWADEIIKVPSYYYLNKIKEVPVSGEGLLFKFASEVWKRLPASLINLLSPSVIKQFV
jgi:hypothetical protein